MRPRDTCTPCAPCTRTLRGIAFASATHSPRNALAAYSGGAWVTVPRAAVGTYWECTTARATHIHAYVPCALQLFCGNPGSQRVFKDGCRRRWANGRLAVPLPAPTA